MRKGMLGFFVVLCCGAFLAGGCAKKEMVKGEAPIPSATKPAETAPAKPPVKEEAGRDQPTKEAPAPQTVKEEPLKEAVQVAAESPLEKVYFDFDSYLLSPSARETLKKDADYLLKNIPAVKVQVEGNCDERGSDEYNLALGEKRSKAALNYLVTLGVPAARLSFISYGKEKPADPGHDEAAWAKNRRAEFIIIK
jgi:peptidoglycan-associated lipoprotein